MARLMLQMLLLFTVASMTFASSAGTSQKSSLPSYALKVSKDGKDYDEQVSANIKEGSETFHLREASSGKDAGDIIYDLKRNLTMIRVPEARACFLSESTKNIPSPASLLQLLKLLTGNAALKITPQTGAKLKVQGTLTDRSRLSRKMVDLCAKLPIYRVAKGDLNPNNMKQTNDAVQNADEAQVSAQRTKRIWKKVCKTVCTVSCWVKCSGWFCHTVCKPVCHKVCSWIFG